MESTTYKISIRPSNLHRRERCPGSGHAEAEVSIPETKSDIASRGNRIHDSISDGLRNPDAKIQILSECDDVEIIEACWDEAANCWDQLTAEQKERATVGIENKVDLKAFGMDEGTPDFYIYIPRELLILRDWKSGMGYVPPARWNLQLGSYACAIIGNDVECRIEIGVFQPAVRKEADVWKTGAIELSETAERIKSIVAHSEAPTSPRIPGGWCTYCRVADQCKERLAVAAEVKTLVKPVEAIYALEGQARADLYKNLGQAIKMLEDAKGRIDEQILTGGLKIEGFCIGNGKKSRLWADNEMACAELEQMALKAGKSLNEIIQPISVAQAEKLFPKQAFSTPILVKEGRPMVVKGKK